MNGRRGFLKGLLGLAMVPVMPTLAVAAKVPVVKVLALNLQEKLFANMAIEIQREIDREIIRDLLIISGKNPDDYVELRRENVILRPRRLKTRWKMELSKDLENISQL